MFQKFNILIPCKYNRKTSSAELVNPVEKLLFTYLNSGRPELEYLLNRKKDTIEIVPNKARKSEI